MSSFDEDIKQMRKQVTAEVAYHINRTPKLYTEMKDMDPEQLKKAVYAHSQEDDNEFGTVFEAELDVVDWEKVRQSI